jgi:hypothetical protein
MRAVVNQYGQSADRYHAMQQLLDLGTVPAIIGLMRRFTMNASKSIEDEEEKGWVFRQVTGLPKDIALPAAKEFCLNNDNIAWVLRIVEELADEKQEWDILDALIEKHPPTYERDPATKQQLLTHLAEIDNPKVPEILARYVDDADEGVRFQVTEALLDIADPRSLDAADPPAGRQGRGVAAPAHQDLDRARAPQVGRERAQGHRRAEPRERARVRRDLHPGALRCHVATTSAGSACWARGRS